MNLLDQTIYHFCVICGRRYSIKVSDLTNPKYMRCRRSMPEGRKCKGELLTGPEIIKLKKQSND